MLMRERIRDSLPQRLSSPSPTSDRDGNESSVIKLGDVSSRSDKIDMVSHRVEEQKHVIDGIRRDSDLYDVEIQRSTGFSNKDRREEEERDDERYTKHFHLQEDSGKRYPESSRFITSHDHPSRLSDEPKPSRFIASHDDEYSPSHGKINLLLRNDKTKRLESISRECSDSSRHSEDGRDRDTYRYESSPLSQVGSSVADFQDESSRLVLRTRRVDDYVGRNSPRDQQVRDLSRGDHDSPVVSRCGKEIVDESRDNYHIGSDIAMREFPSVRHEVNNVARENDLFMQRRGSLSKSYVCGSNIADVDAADSHLELCTKERMSNQSESVKEHYPFVELGSRVVNERDGKDDHYRNFCNEERKVVYLDNKCQVLRKNYLYDGVDSKKNLDFSEPYGVVDRDDKASQSITRCLNKEREAYLDNERNAVFSDDKRQELRNEYHPGDDGRIHSDVDMADIVVDQDGRGVQLQRRCLNKGKAAYLDNERKDVYLNYKSQQLKKDYDSRSDAKIYPDDVNRLDILADREWENSRGLRYRGGSLNDRREAYLQCESQQLLNDYETNSYGMMHPDVNKSDTLVDREVSRGLRYRGGSLNDKKEAYMQCERQRLLNDYETNSYGMMHPNVNKSDTLVDYEDARGRRYRGVSLNDKKEAYLQCERQRLLNDHETDSYVMRHPDVNKSDILVDHEDARGRRSDILVDPEDARGLRYRGVSLNDRKEAYFQSESQQLLKDHETNSFGMMHPSLNKSDILVNGEEARALERRRRSFDDGEESYMDYKRGDAYLHYESQQLKKDHDYGIDDRIYRDVNSSDIIVDHGDAKALEFRRVAFSDRNEAYLDNESKDVYQHYNKQQLKDYNSGIDERVHPAITKSEIVLDRGGARALERRGMSSNDRREAYLPYESQQLLRGHEIDSYGMMHPDVSRSSAGKQDEEALRGRRYLFDDRDPVYLDDERLQRRNGGDVKVHANMRYPDGRQEVYHSNDSILRTRGDYGLRDNASEVMYENMAYDYKCRNAKQSRVSYEKADSKRFREHEVAYDYRDKLGNYAVNGGTSREQFRYSADERNSGNVDHTSTRRRRLSAKERLGGRVVEDSRVHVKHRLHQVRNPNLKEMRSKDKISYFYDGDVGSVYFGPNHPMKPHRLCMTHHLILAYGLHSKMEVYRPHKAYPIEMAQFHSPDYVEFLQRINPENQNLFPNEMARYNLGEDCPVFEDLFEFCQIYAGGTIDAARRLNNKLCDIAINWAGGLHHAKKCDASGFCYINDLVLGILELVMTVSFHKFGDKFFPGTGDVKEIGEREGKFYAINVPLKDGIDDSSFNRLFRTIISKVVEIYQPGAIVLQCGADSLARDRLGCFNLSIDGHAECVKFVKKFNLPLLVTGGGGYTKENVARCWTVETGILLDTELPNEIPENDYIKYFAPDFSLKIPGGHIENLNTKSYISSIKVQILENLRYIQHAPSVQMQEVPPDFYIPDFDEDEQNPDVRVDQRSRDKQIQRDDEYFDGDNDNDAS
ncbi:unnamed protein product [Arabidopsis thaliana]|uniref:histone deacetylase n=1 Tax=Arabidopsis thaliana TaxID=3702 RepID=A0A7G2EV63_ARATH|nr:unnamed protein product [Arabidopsis thaliana]